MNADPDLQTHTDAANSTTYTRADLGVRTAVVACGPDGVEARLYYGPEADEYDTVLAGPARADRLAVEHSWRF